MTQTTGKENLTLIVGTTPDYIDWIRKIAPGNNLFLTDPAMRQNAKEPRPNDKEELLCDLNDYKHIIKVLDEHIEAWGIALDGIACFDCESMDLAAFIAERCALRYPSRKSISLCRSKYLSKLVWRQANLNCPKTGKVRSPEDAAVFLREAGVRVVLKPMTGSGSEHVYLCRSEDECRAVYTEIHAALQDMQGHRLYHSSEPVNELIVAEEFIQGEEYSCDFAVDHDQAALIRLTRKIRAKNRPFGTIHGYVLCNTVHDGIDPEEFLDTIRSSARALQIDRGICMLDFIVRDGEIVLLELAPRPGGDCLPQLLLQARGIDILKLSLDLARQGRGLPNIPTTDLYAGFMGIRIISEEAGTLEAIDTGALKDDPRVLAVGISKEPGHRIIMPPDDYDSWVLGSIIAKMEPGGDPEAELTDLLRKIKIVMRKD